MSNRVRILFIAEAVTLAHVARANVLARSLDPARFDVHCAWDPRYNALLGDLPFTLHAIRSMPTSTFLARVGRGMPMHDAGTLGEYVDEDVSTIRRVQPDLVVGDFRLSLAVSAKLAEVQLISIANAYWSPYASQVFSFPEYDYPLTRVIGRAAARALFQVYRPMGFALHTRPLNAVLRRYHLPEIGSDIRTMYTFGDYTAYADIPTLVPIDNLPANHSYIGAVLWSPDGNFPAWWNSLRPDRPIVYVTLGSSGEADCLSPVLQALEDLPVTTIAATAGRGHPSRVPGNAYVSDFLPGSEASARAALVICNGGSPTTYQALAAGVPVLGLASNNMDQHLNMQAVRLAGAGDVLSARRATPDAIRTAVERILGSQRYREAAAALASAHRACRSDIQFASLIDRAWQQRRSAA